MTASDFMDLSGKHQASIATPHAPIGKSRKRGFICYDNCPPCLTSSQFLPFPPGTRGFLHYYSPEDVPPMAGEIRFRVTTGPDVSSFDDGSDLLVPDGVPWKVPLMSLTKGSRGAKRRYDELQKLLLSDKLVTPELLTQCSHSLDAAPRLPKPRSIIIHSIHQFIPVSFRTPGLSVYLISKDTLHPVMLNLPFMDKSKGHFQRPYSGKSHASLAILVLTRLRRGLVSLGAVDVARARGAA